MIDIKKIFSKKEEVNKAEAATEIKQKNQARLLENLSIS